MQYVVAFENITSLRRAFRKIRTLDYMNAVGSLIQIRRTVPFLIPLLKTPVKYHTYNGIIPCVQRHHNRQMTWELILLLSVQQVQYEGHSIMEELHTLHTKQRTLWQVNNTDKVVLIYDFIMNI